MISIRGVAFDAGQAGQGLRARKKRRTRTTLVDVAAELCLRQGYDRTTVEQIAVGVRRLHPDHGALACRFGDKRTTVPHG